MSSEEKCLYFLLQLHPDVIHIHHSYAKQYVNYRSDLKRLVSRKTTVCLTVLQNTSCIGKHRKRDS